MSKFVKKKEEKLGKMKKGFFFIAIVLIITFSILSSAFIEKDHYLVGQDVKIDLSKYNSYTLKIKTPTKTLLKEGGGEVFLFNLDQIGAYTFELAFEGGREEYSLEVVNEIQEEKEKEDSFVEAVNAQEEINNLSKQIKEDLFEKSLEEESNKELEILGEIRVGEKVKWRKNVNFENFSQLKIQVPSYAENFNVKEGGKEKSFSINQPFLGKALGVLSIEFDKEIVIENVSNGVEIYYETEPPKKQEEIINNFEKEVKVFAPDKLGYKNVLASTEINEFVRMGNNNGVRIYWKEEGIYLDSVLRDLNNNGYADVVEWVVPHLSEQNFEIIIVNKAEHLAEDKSFINDVYPEISFLDDNWSETINSNEYVRVTFEKNLTSKNDITIFPRIVFGEPVIEVYEKDSLELIAKFENIKNNEYNTVLLTELNGSQDTFDLKILGGSIEFDHIIDPTSSYTFSDSNLNKAYWGQPTSSNRWLAGTEATGTQYSNLANNDGVYVSVSPNTNNDEPFWRFNFTINESVSNINWINVVFNGYENAAETARIYIWNYGSSSWANFGIVPNSDGTVSNNYTTSLSNYVDSSKQLVLVVEGANYDTSDSIFVDYVGVDVGYTIHPPTHTNPILNSTIGLNSSSENLTVYNQSTTDLDGDLIKNIINWKVNGGGYEVLNLPFEGGSTSSFNKDYSSYYNNGTVNVAAWLSTGGYDGFGAYSFNGASTYISIPSDSSLDFSGTCEFTETVWINPSHSDAGWHGFLGYQGGGTSTRMPSIWIYNYNEIHAGFGDGVGWRSFTTSTSPITEGVWNHVAISFDGNYYTVYVNGEVEYNQTGAWSGVCPNPSYSQLDIGRVDNYFNGSIDDVRVYNKSLSPQQIISLYNNRTDVIVSEEISVGEIWSACVTPNDGVFDGGELCSNDLTILESVNYGTLSVDLISPSSNIDIIQNNFFDFTVQVNCVGGVCGNVNVTLDPIVYNNSGGVTGTSFSMNIGEPSTNRLVAVFADDESNGNNLTAVTVDGKNCQKVGVADNTNGIGNHQELWYCDEDDLGSSSGTVTIAIAGGDAGWGIHAHVYTGVSQDGPTDWGIDQSSAGISTITVNNIDVPLDGLVVAGWAEGTGGLTINSQTSPLATRLDAPVASSTDFFTSDGIETSAQSGKTYSVTLSGNHNRGTGIVASWEEIATSKGVVPMNYGIPFYTTNQNPMDYLNTNCLENMVNESCNVTWSVNATGSIGTTHEFFVIASSNNYSGPLADAESSRINVSITGLPPSQINISRIYPTFDNVYVEKDVFFNVTLNITCFSGDCGNISVTLDPIVETYSDFETGTEGFEHFAIDAKNDQWHLSTETTNNGSYSWKVGDTASGDYLDYSDSILVTPTYDLEANSTFSFYHYMYTEAGYDGAKLEYSLDGGLWTKVDTFVTGGYQDTYQGYSGGPSGFVSNEDIWSGTIGSSGTFQRVEVNMLSYSGENITFRFHFGADNSVNFEGWYIDSVNFTTQTPSMDKGIIPVGSGSPFYTNKSSNPFITSSLSEGESEIVTFYVNATGSLDSKYFFFAYANETSNASVGDRTNNWNVTISIAQDLPNITVIYPTPGYIDDATPIIDINLTSEAKTLWYNINNGANTTLCTNCDSYTGKILYLREANYTLNVFVENTLGLLNFESVNFAVYLNKNYYDAYEDSSYVVSDYNVDLLEGNITLSLNTNPVIYETFDDSNSWILTGARWELNSGELVQTLNGESFAIYKDLNLTNTTDYNISFEMYAADNDETGLIFGYEDSSNYFVCRLYQQTNQGGLEQISGGGTTTLDTQTAMYSLAQWNNFLVTIEGDVVSCYINDVLTAQASGISLPSAKVGIYNNNNQNVRYDNFTVIPIGGVKSGEFTSYSVNLLESITKFKNITWSESKDNYLNNITVQVSPDDGVHWYDAINGEGISSVSSGQDFMYRVFFDVLDISYLSLLDMNISWTNQVDPPPEIYLSGINIPIEQDFSPGLNITLVGDAAYLVMSINGGINQTICTGCTGEHIIPIILEEGSQIIRVYANNTDSATSKNSTSFIVDYDKHYYDQYLDNYSVLSSNDVIWNYGNMTFFASSSETASSSVWDANTQTGDSTWANSGRTVYTFRNIVESTSISSGGDKIRVKFLAGTDNSLGINNPSICQRSGTTSDCVSGTWRRLKFGGTDSTIISASGITWSDWLEYPISSSNSYMVTFYMDGTNDGVSYVQPGTNMLYSINGADQSLTVDWSGLAPGYEALMYGVDEIEVKNNVTGGIANFTSHSMNTTQEVNGISYAGWTETGVDANNNISLEISVDNGVSWNSISNGGSLSGFTPGTSLVYRVLYSANSVVNLSLQDLNITWASPPTIHIIYPSTYVYNSPVTTLNYTISYASGVSLDTCWYSLDQGLTNNTMTCNQNVSGLTSNEGSNTWFIYANDSSGSLGLNSITFSIDSSAPVLTFLNQTNSEGDLVNSTNPLFEGDLLTINVNTTDTSLDRVWVVIWEGIIGGVEKARYFFNNLFGDIFSVNVPIDETFGEGHNYTIYVNDTTGLNDSYQGFFDILKSSITLNLYSNPNIGNEITNLTGHLEFSNGTFIPYNAINLWFENEIIPFENLTNQGISLDVQNFSEDEIKIYSTYDNISYSSGEFGLDGTNTSGSIGGILDAGARVDWGNVLWTSVSQACSGTVDFQDGNSWGYSNTLDTYITDAFQNTNYGTSNDLRADSSPAIEKSLVKFNDLFGFSENKVPYYSNITTATFRLTLYDTGDNPTVYEILENWTEFDSTYLYRTAGDLWGASGISGAPSRSTTSIGTISGAVAGTKSVDVTSTVDDWSKRIRVNNGFVVDPSGAGGIIFRSSEYSTANERPRITIDFNSDDCNGVLVYFRTSNDKLMWTSWQEVSNGESIQDLLTLSRYLEYKIEMGSFNSTYDPRLQEIYFNYTGTFTDSNGDYNYSFVSPSGFGTYLMNVTSGYKTIYASSSNVLSVQSGVSPEVYLFQPENATWISSSTYNLTYNASDLNGDFKSSLLVLDGASNKTNESIIVEGFNNFSISGLGQGEHNWYVNLSDTSTTNTSEIWFFYVDLEDPIVNLIYPPSNSDYTVGFLNLSFNVTDNLDTNLSCDVVLDSNTIYSSLEILNLTEVNVSSGTLSGGTHFWNVTCMDESGRNGLSETWNFTITDTLPIVNLVSPIDNYVSSGPITNFTYFADDNSGIDRCNLLIDGGIYQTNYSIGVGFNNYFNITGFSESRYNWTVECFDLSNSTATPNNRTIYVDLTAPTVDLISPLNESTSFFSEVEFQFNATDVIDSELNCSLFVNGIEEKTFLSTSGTISSENFSGLDDGENYWYIQCIDDTLKSQNSEIRMVNITEYPQIYLNNSNLTHQKGNSFFVDFTPYDNTQINSCSVYWDGSLNMTVSSGLINGGLNSIEVEGVTEGIHYYYVTCFDGIGLSNSSLINAIYLDNNFPLFNVTFPVNEIVYSDNITFSFEVVDTYSNNLTCNLTVDSIIKDLNFIADNSTLINREISGITDGLHYWNLTCEDLAGNFNSSSTFNFTKSTAPGITLLSPSNNYWINANSFDFRYLPQDDEGFSKTELILNGIVYLENQTNVIDSVQNNFSVTLSDGIYDWSVNVTDLTGLVGVSNTWRLYVDTKEPDLIPIYPLQDEIVTDNNVSFIFNLTDNLDTNSFCNLSIDGDIEYSGVLNNGTNIVNILLIDGDHYWNLDCSDNASNLNSSTAINFSVAAPPIITLIYPSNDSRTTEFDINFSYVPYDGINIVNCSIFVDEVLEDTDFGVIKNIENNFTVLGISEGYHNWSVLCVDPDLNFEMSNYSFFYIDVTPPSIILEEPLNNTAMYVGNGNILFSWRPIDNLDDVISCDLSVDGQVRSSNLLTNNDTTDSKIVSGLLLGYHNWSVECEDTLLNNNFSAVYYFNLTNMEFYVNSSRILFNPTNPVESDLVNVTGVIENLISTLGEDVVIRFYDGDPLGSGVQIGSDMVRNISGNSNTTVYATLSAQLGLNEIFLVVDEDDVYVENDETNNQGNKTITVGSWQFVYGDIEVTSNYTLSTDFGNINVWNADNYNSGSIFVADTEASISWADVLPLGRDTSEAISFDDFSDVDILLGMENFEDSISLLYTNGTHAKNESNFLLFNKLVNNVPIVESINSSNFITGILWDSSDDTNFEYDQAEKEDLIFVTKINKNTLGSYSIVDYEMRIPAKLREYDVLESNEAVFYVEIS